MGLGIHELGIKIYLEPKNNFICNDLEKFARTLAKKYKFKIGEYNIFPKNNFTFYV